MKKLNREKDHKIKYLYSKIDELRNEIKYLKRKIEELEYFELKLKLRKLLKNLLEYLIKNYFKSCMAYNEKSGKLWFKSAPKNIYEKNIKNKDQDISIFALNKILKIIFHYSKKNDCAVHFINKEVMDKKKSKQSIIVFPTTYDFFKYFDIPKLEPILLKYIPKKYFTIIDNSDFETKIPDYYLN